MVKTKNNTNPALDEMNALLALFNQRKLPEALAIASSMVQQYPKHGFAWKVLGAIYQNQGAMQHALDALKNAALFLPNDYEAQYNLGNCFYDQQQLDSAVVCYQNAIQLNPSFAQAHYNLGNVLKKQDLLKEAEQSYKNALRFDVDNVWVLDNLAHVLYDQGHFSEAKDCYERVLKIQPDFVAAHIGLGAVSKALGQLQDAEDSFKRAIEFGAEFEAYSNLADLLHASDRLAEAEVCLRAAISAHPDSVDATVKMAVYLRTLGRVPESIPYFIQALSIDQSRKDVHVDLGLAKADQGLFSEAEVCYRRALELDPDYWLAYNNLGLALHRMERYQEAELAFDKAIALHPSEALLYSNLGLTLAALGQIKKAEASLKKAVEIFPEYVNAHINLCTNYIAQGRLEEAEYECFEALKFDPASNKARSNLLFAMNYSGHHSAEYRLQQALEFNNVVTSKVVQAYTAWQSHPNSRRLRIGLMSGDLRQHPVAYFLENWVRNVDFSQFELTAYLTDIREDAFTGRLKPNFAYWKSLVGLTDQAAAELIHDDGIDILLDLSGHTSGNRLQILAWKPAPIQVSWLGYFATTGMKCVDYFIADEVGVPAAHYAHFVEKIKYLPDTRLCFTAPHVAVDVSALPALTNGYITFASFQTLAKAGDDVLALWAEVMLALPDAKLRWQCKSFGDADVTADMVARFAKLGISADRLTLLCSVSREAYFVAHHEVDVILDTFPYPGGTTTCEALWMGVPTLTLAGDSLIARQGASMLSAAGLADWVAETKVDYLNAALSLCSDLSQLANLRAKLRAQVLASPLFDAERFAKNMEIALWEMWHEHYPVAGVDKVAQAKNAHQQRMKSNQSRHVQIVSATRYSESEFWNKSALGLSLHRHLKQDNGISASIAFNNTLGLSDVFNQAIERADDSAILVFVHDDVWIDEANFVDTMIAGLERFDVIGVAGNKRRLPNQPAWLFVDTALNWDEPEYLSGTVWHGPHAFGEDKFYGDVPAPCELLDGVFIATTKSALNGAHVRFDHQFDFHLYDVDFCRSAREAGLSLGTWPIKLTHQSKGAFGSPHWAQKCQLYFNKWESGSSQQIALQHAMLEVMQMAGRHEAAGELEQAALLYQEVLNIQPDNAEANYHLGIVEFNLNGVHTALPHLEKAVQCKPEDEQYWVTYIDALMQSADVATVLEALELGQKFGLTTKTAQIIAAELDKKNTYKSANEISRQDVINHESIHIYQIYYSEQTKLSNDGGFIGLDNLANERPDWREYWPIRNYLLSNELNDNHFYGFLSPKFKDKTNLTSADVYHFVNEHLDVDVILFSPFFDQIALFLNIFEQGSEAHEGIKQAFVESVAKVAPSVDINTLVMNSHNTVYCNYFVAKPAFWREWLHLCEMLFQEAEDGQTVLSAELNASVKHDGGGAPVKVFVIERIASLMLAKQLHWVSQAYDSKLLPCSNDVLAKYMDDLIQLDTFKSNHLVNAEYESMSDFLALRQLVIDDVNLKKNHLLQQSIGDVFEIALNHEEAGRIEEAKKLYEEILQIQPKHPEVNYKLAMIDISSNNPSLALPKLEIALSEESGNEQYWVSYVDVLMLCGLFDGAVDALILGQQYGLKSNTAESLAEKYTEIIGQNFSVGNLEEMCSKDAILYMSKKAIKVNEDEINDTLECNSKIDTSLAREKLLGVANKEVQKNRPLNYISPFLNLTPFEETINKLIQGNKYNEVLNLIYKSLLYIKFHPTFVGNKVFTPYFDNVLENIDIDIAIDDVLPRDKKNINLVIASEIYDFGGHTKVIQEILEAVENPVLIITDVYDRFAKNHLFEKVSSSLIKCPVLVLPSEAYLDKAKRLAAFINSCAKNVFILSHHEDVVAIAACKKTLDAQYFFVHHADHNPALGNTVAHFKHLDLFESVAKLCAQDLNKPVNFLPTSSTDLGAKEFDYPIQLFSTVTAGSANKFSMTGEVCLSRIIIESLKTCGGKHYHFGELSAEHIQMIQNDLKQAEIDTNLFVYLGNVPSLWDSLCSIDAHIFLGSAPTPGGKSNLEASGAAYPLLAYVPADAPRYLYVGAEAQIGLTWASIAELTSGLKAMMEKHEEFSRQSRQFYLSNCSSDAFKQKLTQLCDAL